MWVAEVSMVRLVGGGSSVRRNPTIVTISMEENNMVAIPIWKTDPSTVY